MKINWDWATFQLIEAKTTQQLTTSVERLMQTLETMNLNDDQLREVLDKFHKLALGHSIVPAKPDEVWQQCVPGHYGVGDTVRVKPDAYSGPKSIHNGRRGRVVSIRGAQVVVAYSDPTDLKDQYYHWPKDLERLL